MKTIIQNTNPGRHFVTANAGTGGPSDEAWAALEQRVAGIRRDVQSLTPDAITEAISAGLRPLKAEIALRERELKEKDGMRVHRSTFQLPAADGKAANAPDGIGGFKLPSAEA